MKIEEVICDQCGARKGKTNHWYRMTISNGFFLYPSDKSSDNLPNIKDICGENCAMRALQDYLNPPIKETNFDTEEMLQTIEEKLPK